MIEKIIISPVASEKLSKTADYLLNKWSVNEAISFLTIFEQSLEQLKEFPYSVEIINVKLRLRRLVISKHNSIIYQSEESVIRIIALFDNRQDPNSYLL